MSEIVVGAAVSAAYLFEHALAAASASTTAFSFSTFSL
jgi:hypothetical protein